MSFSGLISSSYVLESGVKDRERGNVDVEAPGHCQRGQLPKATKQRTPASTHVDKTSGGYDGKI